MEAVREKSREIKRIRACEELASLEVGEVVNIRPRGFGIYTAMYEGEIDKRMAFMMEGYSSISSLRIKRENIAITDCGELSFDPREAREIRYEKDSPAYTDKIKLLRA